VLYIIGVVIVSVSWGTCHREWRGSFS